jgi:hypothetical protein
MLRQFDYYTNVTENFEKTYHEGLDTIMDVNPSKKNVIFFNLLILY